MPLDFLVTVPGQWTKFSYKLFYKWDGQHFVAPGYMQGAKPSSNFPPLTGLQPVFCPYMGVESLVPITSLNFGIRSCSDFAFLYNFWHLRVFLLLNLFYFILFYCYSTYNIFVLHREASHVSVQNWGVDIWTMALEDRQWWGHSKIMKQPKQRYGVSSDEAFIGNNWKPHGWLWLKFRVCGDD